MRRALVAKKRYFNSMQQLKEKIPLYLESESGEKFTNPFFCFSCLVIPNQKKALYRNFSHSYYRIGARYYDADIGMWISPDPARQFHSLYSYAGNGTNPINGTDKDGNCLNPATRVNVCWELFEKPLRTLKWLLSKSDLRVSAVSKKNGLGGRLGTTGVDFIKKTTWAKIPGVGPLNYEMTNTAGAGFDLNGNAIGIFNIGNMLTYQEKNVKLGVGIVGNDPMPGARLAVNLGYETSNSKLALEYRGPTLSEMTEILDQ
jgi:RHS repeat-associated protein